MIQASTSEEGDAHIDFDNTIDFNDLKKLTVIKTDFDTY